VVILLGNSYLFHVVGSFTGSGLTVSTTISYTVLPLETFLAASGLFVELDYVRAKSSLPLPSLS
jgi:hypothetical protein